MNEYCNQAIKRLEKFPKNEASEALSKLFRYIITRKR
jgi:geranylgeranyl pyrophosphate synthase